jgi:hypothetical protein
VKKAKENQTEKDQAKAFRKAARELGCDENEERFKETLRTLAKQKPKSPSPKSSED